MNFTLQSKLLSTNFYVRFLRSTFFRADMFRSLDSLITLLGSPPLHSAPKWLRTVCGKLLTSVLLRPDGVQAVVDFMVGGENEGLISKNRYNSVSGLRKSKMGLVLTR